MAERIVVLGLGGKCLEIPSAMDAGASVNMGMLRASLTKWSGPLANATVLVFTHEYLSKYGNPNEVPAHEKAWENLLAMPYRPLAVEFEVETPIPLAAVA